MSFPRYRKYKDSGVEWLGEVPGHWATPPLYLRYSVELGKMLDSSRITGDHLVPYLRNVDVQWGRINFDDLPEMDIEVSEYGRYTVAPGDLLVCEGGEVGRAAIVPERSGTIGFQKALHRLRVLADDEHPAFMYFTLSWAALRGVFNQSGLSTIAHLTGEQLRKYRFPKPPIAEQTAIAAFLDRETAKIDALVAEQQNLIALLKEKRQALISHAVTRGLDPDVPMKDSGVAWLGELPAHWEVRRLSSVSTKITNGYVGPTRDILVGEGVRYLQSLHIKNNRIVFSQPYYVTEQWSAAHEKSILQKGDVLIVQTGDIGQVAVVSDEFIGCNCHALIIVSPLRQAVTGCWLSWVFNSDYGYHALLSIQTGALHPHLNCGNVKELYVTIPPLNEQDAIVAALEIDLLQFQQLTVEAESAIALLQERRTALISAAVTGKIDVRHLAVASADRTPEPA